MDSRVRQRIGCKFLSVWTLATSFFFSLLFSPTTLCIIYSVGGFFFSPIFSTFFICPSLSFFVPKREHLTKVYKWVLCTVWMKLFFLFLVSTTIMFTCHFLTLAFLGTWIFNQPSLLLFFFKLYEIIIIRTESFRLSFTFFLCSAGC